MNCQLYKCIGSMIELVRLSFITKYMRSTNYKKGGYFFTIHNTYG